MRKITLFIASLFLTIGAMAQVVADGVYTIQADENGKRGYLAASASHARPVLTEISWSDYAGNSCTDIVENGKLWCVKNVDGVAYICNIGNGMFIEDNGTDDIFFGAPSAFNITQHNSYIHVGSGEGIRYLSMGCGAKAPSQVKWEKGNANDGGCLLTFKAVEGDYSAQIAAVEKYLERSKKYVSYGVYTVSNNFNNRGTLAYGTYNGTEYFGLANITLSGYAGNSVAVEKAANAVWYTVETEKGRYIYNVGKGLFLQNATQTNASCAAEVATGFTYEVRTNGGNSYVSIKDGNYYLSCSCGWKPNEGQVRWLANNEEAATLLTLTSVTPFAYADAMAAADAAIAEFEAPALEAFVPTSYAKNASNDYELKGVKINFAEVVKKADVTEFGKIVDAEGNTVAVLNSLMGANGTSATYATPYSSTAVTTPGTYKVIVYSGVFFNADGTKEFKGAEYEFEVAELPAPEVESIDAPAGTVNNMDWYLDYGITIYNTREVVLADDKTVTYTVGEEVFEAELFVGGTGINRSISISFPWDVTYPYGDYILTIPAGLYTVNGVANEAEVYNFSYAKPTPTPGEGEGGEGGEVEPVTVTVTPASGTVVEQIEAVQVLFSNEMMYEKIGYLYMFDQNDNLYYLAPAPDYGTGVFVPVNIMNDAPIVITEPGTYTINLASYAEFGLTGDMEFSWTIEGVTTAIDSVNAEAENAVIYDLTGRRVEKITKAGIYVINGVKKVVK